MPVSEYERWSHGNEKTNLAVHRFDEFIEYEVNRIRQNLETIHYTFKNVDSVYTVTGPGKIAKVR